MSDIKGKRYFCAVTDELTGYVDGEPLGSKNERVVSECLLKLCLRNGILGGEIIVTDGGSEWAGIWNLVTKALHLNHVKTTAYFSQSNGRIERVFRELNVKFRLLEVNRKHWSLYLPYMLFILNNTPRETLGWKTPVECLFGRSMHLPYTYSTQLEHKSEDFLKVLSNYMAELHPELMKLHYERFRKLNSRLPDGDSPKMDVGQKCFTYKPTIENGKLSIMYQGPYYVLKQIYADSYILECRQTNRRYRRHIKYIRIIPDETTITVTEKQAESTNTLEITEK